MKEICDICGGTIKGRVFRCSNGKICKNCFTIVSDAGLPSVVNIPLQELKKRYIQTIYRAISMRRKGESN